MRERLNVSTTTTARHTVNYDLPQWNGEDVTSWLVNLNDAFNKIDSAMWENHTAMAGYDKIASDLQKLADDLRVDNREIRESLDIIQRGMADQLTQLNQAKQDIANANIAITQLQQEDNALSAMVEDLQDDVGMMMNWRKWKKFKPSSPMQGTVTGSDSNVCNWKLVDVGICNGVIYFNIKLLNALAVSDGNEYILEFTAEDSSSITEWLKEQYPPLRERFQTTTIHTIAQFGLSSEGLYRFETTAGESLWRIQISAMKTGRFEAGTVLTGKTIAGGDMNE